MPAAPPSRAQSRTHSAVANALVERRVEPRIGIARPVVEVEAIGGCSRIIAVAHETLLLQLEGSGHLDLAAQAQEYRTSVFRQKFGNVLAEFNQIEFVTGRDGS